jgi:hypothetical protein
VQLPLQSSPYVRLDTEARISIFTLLQLRGVLLLAVIAILAGLIAWAAWLWASGRRPSTMPRGMLVVAIVVLTTAPLWITFVLPVYLD